MPEGGDLGVCARDWGKISEHPRVCVRALGIYEGPGGV